ncbi:hypothetical protein GCM10010218_28320 [Streptomyces mashuensis]|uniref:N-acetyltransferase domain-containing protein n=1 Tax=Streptomyces mashuensis TaxID=33904 RepID=A0A919B297_9ACTN|nr:GNAT family N-acetyltransferase [Streptomyces mashuensis]GHF45446.1 hypothetical protein GCM10010218_28320 [Streptomyces mashuensis]
MKHTIRQIRADEWRQAKELRLDALQDPVASIAFLDTYEDAVARPDSHWQQRTADAAEGKSVTTLVAEAPDGTWTGSVTVLVELPGQEAVFGGSPTVPQTHLVGVYVRPAGRGTGLAEELLRAAVEWSWGRPDVRVERARLYVHERNLRAMALYRKLGFEETGVTVPMERDPSATEYELAVGRPDA